MKLVFCLECGDIFSPGVEKPNRCKCGYSLGQWFDPQRGILMVANRWSITQTLVLGLNNHWLYDMAALMATPQHEDNECCKEINERTSQAAEGYLFKLRNCPIIMVRPGRGDIYENKELLEKVPWYGKYDRNKSQKKEEGEAPQ